MLEYQCHQTVNKRIITPADVLLQDGVPTSAAPVETYHILFYILLHTTSSIRLHTCLGTVAWALQLALLPNPEKCRDIAEAVSCSCCQHPLDANNGRQATHGTIISEGGKPSPESATGVVRQMGVEGVHSEPPQESAEVYTIAHCHVVHGGLVPSPCSRVYASQARQPRGQSTSWDKEHWL